MNRADAPGTVRIRRHMENEHSALLAIGDFSDLLAAWRRHVSLWEGDPDPFSHALMQDGLAAASLHLSNRLKNEVIAWTLNLREPRRNLFLTGGTADGHVTGRVMSEGVRVEERSRLFVQVSRPRHEPHTSVTAVEGLDLLDIFEQFYAQSEQLPARFFRLPEEIYVSIHALPGVDRDWIASLEIADTLRLAGASPLIEERIFRFECGCTPEKMHRTVRALFGDKPDELFREDSRVEVSCPRCGRQWWLSREEF
jgi:molecular chaperone Hsp33